MAEGEYSMVHECTDYYEARSQDDGSLRIEIRVPRRFADLWLVILTELTASDTEILYYDPDQPDIETSSDT